MADGIEECDACAGHISWVDAAYACSMECTFCPECAEQYGHVCPNCSGELTVRARRTQPLPGTGAGGRLRSPPAQA